jgi:aryl-alcohol dehydrogenase-like predicted oxidoreductase
VLPTSEREGLGQIVWSPLAQGVLTGKYSGGRRPEGSRATDRQRNQFMSDFLAPDVLDRVERLRSVAAAHGLSLAQLALAWCLRTPAVSSVIVGATRAEQLEENVGASGHALAPQALEEIERIVAGAAR